MTKQDWIDSIPGIIAAVLLASIAVVWAYGELAKTEVRHVLGALSLGFIFILLVSPWRGLEQNGKDNDD